jgi:uncharacterized phage-associated protein
MATGLIISNVKKKKLELLENISNPSYSGREVRRISHSSSPWEKLHELELRILLAFSPE